MMGNERHMAKKKDMMIIKIKYVYKLKLQYIIADLEKNVRNVCLVPPYKTRKMHLFLVQIYSKLFTMVQTLFSSIKP